MKIIPCWCIVLLFIFNYIIFLYLTKGQAQLHLLDLQWPSSHMKSTTVTYREQLTHTHTHTHTHIYNLYCIFPHSKTQINGSNPSVCVCVCVRVGGLSSRVVYEIIPAGKANPRASSGVAPSWLLHVNITPPYMAQFPWWWQQSEDCISKSMAITLIEISAGRRWRIEEEEGRGGGSWTAASLSCFLLGCINGVPCALWGGLWKLIL